MIHNYEYKFEITANIKSFWDWFKYDDRFLWGTKRSGLITDSMKVDLNTLFIEVSEE